MQSFIQDNFTNITKGIEIIAAVTGIVFFKKYKGTPAIFFIYFLIYAVFVENFGNYTKLIKNTESLNWIFLELKGSVFEKNYWWYQIFWIIGCPLFFSLYFYKVSNNSRLKNYIKVVGILFCLISFSILFYNWNTLYSGHIKIIDIFSLLVILFLVFSFYFELLKSDRILKFYKSLNFYISVGILVFWIIITPVTFYEIYFSEADWNFIILKWQIFLFAIVFMYSIFTIGLIVSKPKFKN